MKKEKSLKILKKLAARLDYLEQKDLSKSVKSIINKFSQAVDSPDYSSLSPSGKIINVQDGLWSYNINTETCAISVATAPQQYIKTMGKNISKDRYPDSYNNVLQLAKSQGHKIRCAEVTEKQNPYNATPPDTRTSDVSMDNEPDTQTSDVSMDNEPGESTTNIPQDESVFWKYGKDPMGNDITYKIKRDPEGRFNLYSNKNSLRKGEGSESSVQFFSSFMPAYGPSAGTTTGYLESYDNVLRILGAAPQNDPVVQFFKQEVQSTRSFRGAANNVNSIEKIAKLSEIYSSAYISNKKTPFGRR